MTSGLPEAEATYALDGPLDLVGTLAPIAHGRGDPTIRLTADGAWRATRTPDGPATLHLRLAGERLVAHGWGPGAGWAVARADALAGLRDDPSRLIPHHRLVAELARSHPGLRLPRTERAFDALLPAICEQKVTGVEARAAYRAIIAAHGEPAPDSGQPGQPPLRLAPEPARLAALPYYAYHPLGLERRRADVIRAAARLAPRLDAASDDEAMRLMGSVPGIGPWTLAEVRRVAFGDPDAISVGDYHLPNLVAWALAREPRADDARMLQLLEPYVGQRGRVQRLLEASGLIPPRYGPRMATRSIAGM